MIMHLGDRFKVSIFADQFVEGDNGCVYEERRCCISRSWTETVSFFHGRNFFLIASCVQSLPSWFMKSASSVCSCPNCCWCANIGAYLAWRILVASRISRPWRALNFIHRGMDIWRIETFKPVPLPKTAYGKFYMGDSYIVLRVNVNSSLAKL